MLRPQAPPHPPGPVSSPGAAGQATARLDLAPTRTRLLLEVTCGVAVTLAGVLMAQNALGLSERHRWLALASAFPLLYAITGAGWALKSAWGLWRPPVRLRLDSEGVHSLALWPPRQRVAWNDVLSVRRCRLPLAGQLVFVARRARGTAPSWLARQAARVPLLIDARSLSMDARELVPLLEGRALASALRQPRAPPPGGRA